MAITAGQQDILDKVEALTTTTNAYKNALLTASALRESTLAGLGADFSNSGGNAVTVDQAADVLGPGGQSFKGFTMKTGFGEGTLPTITKEGVGAVGAAVTEATMRGVGEGGLVGQTRLIGREQANIERDKAITAAQEEINKSNVELLAKEGEKVAAKAALATARGRRVQGPKTYGTFSNKSNAKGGILKPSNRGAYNTKATPQGKVPKAPTAGQTFTGKAGVNFVYRTGGPKGAGWYKKGA